ncbi:hypothetical protein I4U23_006448 [Adineta vaga]|nr:hypothetical protein I4U23_006448 [Adineta vaga]
MSSYREFPEIESPIRENTVVASFCKDDRCVEKCRARSIIKRAESMGVNEHSAFVSSE